MCDTVAAVEVGAGVGGEVLGGIAGTGGGRIAVAGSGAAGSYT
jgi:hypothetical protein